MKKYIILLFFLALITGCGESSPPPVFDPGDGTVDPVQFDIYPSKYVDKNNPDYTYFYKKTIEFNLKNDLDTSQIPEDEWGNVELKFRIEACDDFNEADNNLSQTYNAQVNGRTGEIPRPSGLLDKYSATLSPGISSISVEYTSSDVSGKYKIILNLYYKGENKVQKESYATVKIPDLVAVDRDCFDTVVYFPRAARNVYFEDRLIYKVVGQTEFHQCNNYLQSPVTDAFKYMVQDYIKTVKENYDEWHTVRVNEMTLPWGGLFWIGWLKSADLTLQRKDGSGNDYTITYRADTDRGIYAQPHITHRQGRCLDIGTRACDESGNYDETKPIKFILFKNSLELAGFDIITEGDHYHITYNQNDAVTYYGSYKY